MIMKAMIETLVSRIYDGALEGVEKIIMEKKVEKERKKRIENLLEELKDISFYMALDNYISTDKIIDKMIMYCDTYTSQNIEIKKIIDEMADKFLKCNEPLNYINRKYLNIFFQNLFFEIFTTRYYYKKNSNQEIIIANLKREFEIGNFKTNNHLNNIEKRVEKIYAKICQDDFALNDKRFQFLEKYNNRLFLEEDNEKAITLKDIYVTPQYREQGEIKNNIQQYIDDFIFNQNEDNVLFIVGQPTTGKSSLLCDLISRYIFRDDIIALQLKELDESKDLISGLKSKLQCSDKDFANRILILDGFDEAKVCKNENINHIDKMCRDFIHELQSLLPSTTFFKVILTIRTDFFKLKWKDDYEKVRVIELIEFDRKQIKEFQSKYLTKKEIAPQIVKFINRELSHKRLGIITNPMMLYMICRYEGDLSCEIDKSYIYDSIFSQNSPLFLSLYKGKGHGENREHIEKYYNIIGKIAFTMYEKRILSISEQEVKKIIPEIDNNLNRFTGMAILSKDNGEINQIEFIHSTICAYFAAKYIYSQVSSIYKLKINQKEKILEKMNEIFSCRNIEGEVWEFLQYFIIKGEICKQEKEHKVLLNAVSFVLEKNCIYSLESEGDVPLLERIHNAFNGYWKVFTTVYLQINKNKLFLNNLLPDDKNIWRNLGRLLKNGSFNKIYLRGSNFSGIDLRSAILKGADISSSDLSNADMRGTSLVDAKLCNSNLDNANLNGADLCKADLQEASLKGLKIRGSVLKECKFKNNKNVYAIKFSYSNVLFVQGIREADLYNCFVYDTTGKMKTFKDWKNE